MNDAQVPEHVRAAFGAAEGDAVPMITGSATGWVIGPVVLSPAVDPGLATWSARVREGLTVDGLRVAQPVRSRDGRLVVSGWRADRTEPGRPEARADQTMSWALRIADALADVERPRLVHRPHSRPWSEPDVFALAERAAWEGEPEVDLAVGMEDRGTPFATHRAAALLGAGALVRRRHPVEAAETGLVHGDLARGLLFDGPGVPALTDLVPYSRPAEWSAAVVAVDHLTWGTVDAGVCERWNHLQDWPQMLLRAMTFRLSVHAVHPDSVAAAVHGLQSAARTVEAFLIRCEG